MRALELVAQFLGLFALVQGFEFLSMRRVWSEDGAWTWASLAGELSPLGFFLKQNSFLALNILRLVVGATVIAQPSAWSVGLLLLIHVLTVVRWLGSFNGGSDYMNSLLLLFTWLGLLFPERLGAVCLWYMAFQLCLSYFKAGWIKFKNVKWRRGVAIPRFVLTPIYENDRLMTLIFESPRLALIISWVTIIFELLFPLSIVEQRIAVIFMGVGFFFHLGNAYVFGLNRFVFAWIAAYPALYWCAGLKVFGHLL